MIQRSEVEALLATATYDINQLPGYMTAVSLETMDELCRTWLAVQDAPSMVVELEPRSKLRAVAGNTNTMLGQRVRLVADTGSSDE